MTERESIKPGTTTLGGVAIRTALVDLAIILCLWCLGLILVDPLVDFPLNDDWSFSLAVKHLLDTGEFRPTGWTSMSLLTQTLWGSLFCLPLGFSFIALRLSTLVLSVAGLIGVYLLLMELQKDRLIAIIVSLTVGFCSLYFTLSNTYMTDVPYVALTVLASLCFVRDLGNNSISALIVATILSVAATLTRQVAISVPLAFCISLLVTRPVSARTLVRAVFPPLLCISALLVFQHHLVETHRLPALYTVYSNELIRSLSDPRTVFTFIQNCQMAACYLGMFLLPVSLLVVVPLLQHERKKVIRAMTVAAPLVVAATLFVGAIWGKDSIWLPVDSCFGMGNIIIKSGIGPLTLPDVEKVSLAELPTAFWLVVTGIGWFAAFILTTLALVAVLGLVSQLRRARHEVDGVAIFLVLCVLIYLLPFLITGFYDRYLMPVVPLFAALITTAVPYKPTTKTALFLSASVLAAMAFFAVATTRDYFEWNRVRWGALGDLVTNENVIVEQIDGGLEFNAWFLYDPAYKIDPSKSWWWVVDDTYKLGFGPIPGYVPVKEYGFSLWMPPGKGRIVVQKRDDP